MGKHDLATSAHFLDLLPLRRIGHRHPQQSLIALEVRERYAEGIPAQDEHGARPGAICLAAGFRREARREDLAARRTAECVSLIAPCAEQGVAIEAYLHSGGQRI
jgi:hypothetical protein